MAAEAEVERLRTCSRRSGSGSSMVVSRPTDRDAEMSRFRDGELDVLVGTTVIEVGVDVPEATVMIVEGADRFGLAQLHQLRGRVGRGTAESFCVLVSDVAEGTVGLERLKAIVELTDGFELAEKDFELRGEGDVLGLAQSGLPALRVASLQRREHRELAARARTHAEALLADRRYLRARAGRSSASSGPAGSPASGPASRPAAPEAWPTPGGSSPGGPRGSGWSPRGRDAAARRPGQGDAVRDPRARPVGARGARPLRWQRRRRDRGAVARSGVGRLRRARRGAAEVIAREPDPDAPRRAAARVVRRDVLAYLARRRRPARPFDVVLVDPPYDDPGTLPRTLERLGAPEALAPLAARGGCGVVAKHFWRTSARAGRAASIRAPAPLRGDGADVLPADGEEAGQGG